MAESAGIEPEDLLRARFYGFLAGLLARSPEAAQLEDLRNLQGDETPIGICLTRLAEAARKTDPETLREEYDRLFIGVVRGQLQPYGSFYLTGFLYEKPLAQLRSDMQRLGIARVGDVAFPEDHVASILEMMQGLIEGEFGAALGLTEQERFFDAHIRSWMPKFFDDLKAAEDAPFYGVVGGLAKAFLDIEIQAFAIRS